jgi:hypothetical protein
MSKILYYILGLLFEIGVVIMLILPYFISVPDYLIYIAIMCAIGGVIFSIMGGINNSNSQASQNVATSATPVKEVLVVHTSSKQPSEKDTSRHELQENRPVPAPAPMSSVTPLRHNMQKEEFMAKIVKLSEIVQSCQDLVENETELTNREDSRLYLKRREFKVLFNDIKSAPFDSI